MASIISYRRPRSTFQRVLKDRRRSISSSIQRQERRPTELLSWAAIPEWHRDNHFITSGYREESHSTWTCVQSMFAIHNETVNIWTHLIPALVFTFSQLLVQMAINICFPEASPLDRFVFAANIAAATITTSLSTIYHTLMCHSQEVSNLWLRIDYVGILTLILGSFFSGIYVGFYCESIPRSIYWTMITTLSCITALLVLHPNLQGLRYRSLRTWAFVLTGLSGFAPIIHGLWLYGYAQMWVRSGMPYYLLEGLIYGLGAFFFAARIPESIWPGRFDIWCSSHQIFHVLVVLASLVHIYGIWDAFGWNYDNQRVCPVPEKGM